MSGRARYAKALAFAAEKHAGQYRVGGLPYITHPVAVAGILWEQGYDTSHQLAGLLHDLPEDTDAAMPEIESLGSPETADAARRLTRTDGYVMAEYVAGIRVNPMAMAVKALILTLDSPIYELPWNTGRYPQEGCTRPKL